ncbi:MAG: hypothetical protein JXB05_27635 [Myxococcaceae bacterium]|nr:hypothetical protein [Myxococcaceae bacterium]
MGDQLQAAAKQAARRWSPSQLTDPELDAISAARAQGKYWRAQQLERMARGKFVENQLRDQFKRLEWSRTGVAAVDPSTGYKYEILTGTHWNMELHGRRMADEFFRLITFL